MFYYLSLAAALFAIGFYGLIAHKTAAGKLLSLLVMLNSILINVATFDKFVKSEGPAGRAIVVFVLVISTAQLLFGVYNIYLSRKNNHNADDAVKFLS